MTDTHSVWKALNPIAADIKIGEQIRVIDDEGRWSPQSINGNVYIILAIKQVYREDETEVEYLIGNVFPIGAIKRSKIERI